MIAVDVRRKHDSLAIAEYSAWPSLPNFMRPVTGLADHFLTLFWIDTGEIRSHSCGRIRRAVLIHAAAALSWRRGKRVAQQDQKQEGWKQDANHN